MIQLIKSISPLICEFLSRKTLKKNPRFCSGYFLRFFYLTYMRQYVRIYLRLYAISPYCVKKGPRRVSPTIFSSIHGCGAFLFKAILNTFNYILERKRFFIGPVLTLYFSGTFSRAYRDILIPLRIISPDIHTNPRFTFQ